MHSSTQQRRAAASATATRKEALLPRRKGHEQPLEVIHIPDALLTKWTVMALTGWSDSTLRRKLHDGFPLPVMRTHKCTRWKASDVAAYLARQGAQ